MDTTTHPVQGISLPEAAEMLGVSTKTVIRLTDDGTLPYVKIRSMRRVLRSDVEALLRGEHS